MTPDQLYNSKPVKISHDLLILLDAWHCHIPEIEDGSEFNPGLAKNTRVAIAIYHDPYIDGERCCVVGAAFFDNKPVMIFRHGGRGGHDAYDEFVTNKSAYEDMVRYMQSLTQEVKQFVSYDPMLELPDLDSFYGNKFSLEEGVLCGKANEFST